MTSRRAYSRGRENISYAPTPTALLTVFLIINRRDVELTEHSQFLLKYIISVKYIVGHGQPDCEWLVATTLQLRPLVLSGDQGPSYSTHCGSQTALETYQFVAYFS